MILLDVIAPVDVEIVKNLILHGACSNPATA
jgi:hypothetical protein